MPSSSLCVCKLLGIDQREIDVLEGEEHTLHRLWTFQKTSVCAKVFWIHTFQNDASEKMIKCEDYFEATTLWLELLDDYMVVHGPDLFAREELWPDKNLTQLICYIISLGNMVRQGILQQVIDYAMSLLHGTSGLNQLGYGKGIHMQSVVVCPGAVSLDLSAGLTPLGSKNNDKYKNKWRTWGNR